ncbi:MAG: phosphoribosyltransferase family protein [Planctomycetaceae bacterium]
MGHLRSGWQHLGDFVYPPCCGLCGGDLCDGDEPDREPLSTHLVGVETETVTQDNAPKGGGTQTSFEVPEDDVDQTPFSPGRVGRELVCGRCRENLLPKETNVCWRCSAPVGPYLKTNSGCVHCARDRFQFTRALALGAYEGELKRVCLLAKQREQVHISGPLGKLLCERWGAELAAWRPDVVVAVPRHWTTRLRSIEAPPDVLGEVLADFLLCPLERHILRKRRRTSPQSTLKPAERRRNLRDAFRMARGVRLDGCRVLLVDDVLTTGTTANEVTRTLKSAGAAEVLVAVVARGIGAASGPT